MVDVAAISSGGAPAAASASNIDHASADLAASIPESANVYRTPNSSSNAPRITISKSATAVEMEAMVNPSPSQEAFRTLTRASSFHGYPDGDTQPMESQVYRDFNESRAKSATTTPKKNAQSTFVRAVDQTNDTVATDRSPKTCVEGDPGFIDLSKAFPSPGGQSMLSSIEDILTSPEARQLMGESESIVNGAAQPKTPNVAGHRRKRSGEILTSITTAKEQPGYSQFFGQNVPMMTTTQLFNQTQAPSSPVPDGPRSDPVITRPSPNLHHQFSASSPSLPVSSPLMSMRPATAGGPRDHYKSMFESQLQRLKSRSSVDRGFGEDPDDALLSDDEEENDTERRRFESKRLRDAKSAQTLQEFQRFGLPLKSRSRPTSSSRNVAPVDLTTPAAAKIGDPFGFEPSEDGEYGEANDEDQIVVTEHEEYTNLDDDQYDEFGQTVLRSQGPEADDDDDVSAEDHEIQVHDEAHANGMLTHASDRDPPLPDLHAPEIRQPQLSAHDIAIADSQPIRGDQTHSKSSQATKDGLPLSSFVPGSQPVESTGIRRGLERFKPPDQVVARSDREDGQDAISSPVLPVASSVLPPNPTAPLAERTDDDIHQVSEPIVLESDLPVLDLHQDEASRPLKVSNDDQSGSNSNPNMFSTAATHLSEVKASPQKAIKKTSPQKLLASQQSIAASQSPLRAAGVRRFADIAGAQSLSRGESRETDADIDAFMKDLISEQDQQFIEAVSSPPPKRRKLGRETSVNKTSSPRRSEQSNLPLAPAADVVDPIEANAPAARNEEVNSKVNDRSTTALQESPSKANEMPSSTQDSVVEREKAGAKAVSQLISKRTTTKPMVQSRNGRAATRRMRLRAPENSKAAEVSEEQKVPAITSDGQLKAIEEDDAMTDVPKAQSDQAKDESTKPTHVLSPDRVFALFKGTYNKFYPAIWLGSTADGSGYHVKFNDALPIAIETQHVRKLELHIGDLIKVDMKDMRSQTWIVRGFGDSVASNNAEVAADTDVYGHATVKVEAKSSRNSSDATAAQPSDLMDVPITAIYLTHTLWPHFADRTFIPPKSTSLAASKGETPASSMQTSKSETPTTKARRTIVPTAKAMAGHKLHSAASGVSNTAIANASAVGMFAGMVFALSFGQNEGEKEEVARLIRSNGGNVVENGFDELFDLPNIGYADPTMEEHAASSNVTLRLKPQYEALGFVALIADKHSRRAKYMQALALNLPTLSGRWIMDSLSEAKNNTLSTPDASPLPWPKYLLPAGESLYLNGATRSRIMPTYPCRDAFLQTTINAREVLLGGDGVLIVTPKKGKANIERSNTYAFLTLALGASHVKRVPDLQEAKTLILEQPFTWNWIYVDGSVAEAGDVVFGKAKGAGKKRKRSDESGFGKGDLEKTFVADSKGRVKVVNDEFVVQSLILGALMD